MILDRLEALVEGVVDGFFHWVLRGKIQPLEIARRLTREADTQKVISLNRVYVPNRFTVGLHAYDLGALRAIAPELQAELRRFVGEWVLEREYTVTGPVVVEFRAHERVRRGRARIASEFDEVTPDLEIPELRRDETPPDGTPNLDGRFTCQSGVPCD